MSELLNTAIGPFTAKIWLAILAALALAAWAVVEMADNSDRRKIDVAKEAGAAEAVTAGHRTTLQQSGAANEAGNQVRDNRGSARFDECLRSATTETRVNCERFRNERLSD